MNASSDQSIRALCVVCVPPIMLPSTLTHPAAGGQLHAVSGPEFSLNPWARKPTGYIVDMEAGQLTGTWNVPGGLQNPHDVAVTEDGGTVYVVELNPFKVWKLSNGGSEQRPRQDTESGTSPPPAPSRHNIFDFIRTRLSTVLG